MNLARLLQRRDPSASGPELAAIPGGLAKAIKEAKVREYRAGMSAGIAECLDQLEGRGSKFAQGPAPELTPGIRDWIAVVRSRLDQVDAEDRR